MVKKVICGANVSYLEGASISLERAHGIVLDKEIEKFIKEDQRREREGE